MNSYRAVRANEMIGMPVVSPNMQNLGAISDLVIDMRSGDVRYAILEFDRGLMADEARFAVPTRQLQLAQGRNALIYQDMSRERLEQAAIRRSDEGAAGQGLMGNAGVWERIDRNWGIQQPTNRSSAMLASSILDKDVTAADGSEIGEIETLVIDLASSRVHYAVLEFDPGWLSPERKVALPLAAFDMASDQDELRLTLPKERASQLAELDRNWFANLNDPRFVAEVDRSLATVGPSMASSRGDVSTMGAGSADANPALFKRLDTDGNGYLSRNEFDVVADLQRHWGVADVDKDGWISSAEFSRFRVTVERR